MDKAIIEHFSSRVPKVLYFLTFVNNSKDLTDRVLFTISRVNDWFRKRPEIAKSWFIVEEQHKDLRNHYHVIADLDYTKFKPSQFIFKIAKKVLRVHIQVRVNGNFISSTFARMSKSDGCRTFVNGISKGLIDQARARKSQSNGPGRRGERTMDTYRGLTTYLAKSPPPLAKLVRYGGWCCSCSGKTDHNVINNYFPKYSANPYIRDIFEYAGVLPKVSSSTLSSSRKVNKA